MIELSPIAAAVLASLAGIWLAVAAWATIKGRARFCEAAGAIQSGAEGAALLAASPAMPLLVLPSGEIEGQPHLWERLGLDHIPSDLATLTQGIAGLAEQIEQVRSSGGSFSIALRPGGSSSVLLVSGSPAPAVYAEGTVLLWIFDATESEEQLSALRSEVGRLTTALDALTALLEAAPFPMWHRGPDLRLALVNSAYVRAVEAESAIAVIKSGIELVDEGEGRNALSQAAAVLQKSKSLSRTVPATIAGERRMMQVVEVPLGEGVAGYAIDVEDREQAHAELSLFVRAQRDMLDRLSAGVAQFSRDRGLVFFNQPFCRLFTLSTDFLADEPEFDRVLDSMREMGNLPEVRDFPEWKREKRGWFTSGLAADEEDWLLPGGKHLRVVAQPLPDGGLLLIFEDRTEQIQLASARDTLLRVRTATFDNLFEAIGVFASDGRLHLWNNRFKQLWQFDEEQLAAHPRIDTLVPHIAKKLKKASHAAFVRELVRSATVERKQRNGRVAMTDGRDFEFAAVPLPDGNALFTMLDITDSRMIEAALRDKNEALEDADRLKTAFVSNMSYELRTPLTSIGGFAEMLAGGYAGELPPTAVEYIAAIITSVSRLGALIDNVLDLTQSDSGSLLLAEDSIDLRLLCAEAGENAGALAQKKEIVLTVEISPSVGELTGDRRRLREALENVLKNALTYTAGGGAVTLRATGTARAVEIIVSDNGCGIAPADRVRVFDRFHRTTPRGSGEDAALGLGLPLAKQYIEAHGGSIELESEPGEGTTVTLHLPRSQ
ncbi:MAG: PAS-domain containing protein [Pseudomonadota bacterium]|nr:PAS-domain containing protein [Pseudomonadota bacterium]